MKLNPRTKYIDSYDGTVKTGSAWMKYFAELCKTEKRDYGVDNSIDWQLWLYTDANEDHHLTPVNRK